MNQSASTAPDVMVEDTFLVNSDAAAGYLLPMTKMVQSWPDWNHEFFKPMQAAASSSNGTIYGVPFNTDTRGIYYNKVLFKQAGLPVPWQPKTWSDVLQAAQTIKSKLPGVVPLWFYSGKAMGEASTMQGFEMLLYGTKNTLYDFKTNKWIVKSKGFQDSLAFVQNIFQKGLAEPLQDALTPNSGVTATQQMMPKGKAAMLISGDWEYSNWLTTGAAPWSQWHQQIAVAPMPKQFGGGYTSLSGGWVLSISSKSKLSNMALDFIKIAANKPNMAWLDVATSNITPRKDISAMPSYKNAGDGMLADFSKFNAWTVFRPANADYPKVSNEIMAAMENVMTGSMTPQKAMDNYARQVTTLLGKNKVETK
jgi:multiple sugar transport system substrate-binding protein